MKKIYLLLILLLVVGCSINKKLMVDTPTKKVEKFFSKYQTLNKDVINDLDDSLKEYENMSEEDKNEYKELIKNHYKNIKYEIKDEIIDGDNATVKVEIEVTDYSKVMKEADDYLKNNQNEFNDETGIYSATLFLKYKLSRLKEAKEKVKYTLDITLTKIEDEWLIDTISDEYKNKIHGMYIY